MKINLFGLLVVTFATLAYSADRPKITGIDHVAFYTSSPDANSHLYIRVLGLTSVLPFETGQTQRYIIGKQWVGYSPALDSKSTNRMDHAAFATDNAAALAAYMHEKGIQTTAVTNVASNGSRTFRVKDPEGHTIEFVERSKRPSRVRVGNPNSISQHMIHVGFIVRNREAEDHFYKDILGFHIYWHGGMQDNRTDWVAMQVPDGTDWLEYMLNIKQNPDLHTTGVMNHISLGVKDIKQAQARLESRGWKPHGEEHAQMGRDGKWQLNLYEPDQTRIELMEFTPAEKPCCSEFTGRHPAE